MEDVTFTEADGFKDARGDEAIGTLNEKLKGALQNVTRKLTLAKRYWLASSELAIVVRKLLQRQVETGSRMRPFVLWCCDNDKGEYVVDLNSTKQGRFMVVNEMNYDAYLEVVQNPETVHIAGDQVSGHFGQVTASDLSSVYWAPKPSRASKVRRKSTQPVRTSPTAVIDIAKDETDGSATSPPDAANKKRLRSQSVSSTKKPISRKKKKL